MLEAASFRIQVASVGRPYSLMKRLTVCHNSSPPRRWIILCLSLCCMVWDFGKMDHTFHLLLTDKFWENSLFFDFPKWSLSGILYISNWLPFSEAQIDSNTQQDYHLQTFQYTIISGCSMNHYKSLGQPFHLVKSQFLIFHFQGLISWICCIDPSSCVLSCWVILSFCQIVWRQSS